MTIVYVVEGRHDAMRLHQIEPNASVVVTGGANIKQHVFDELIQLKKTHALILLLDPDAAGLRIRRRLEAVLGECQHIHLPKELCTDKVKDKIGIEHASLNVLKDALNHVRETVVSRETLAYDYYQEHFVIPSNARRNRIKVARALHLPMGNAKAFYQTLKRHGISQEQLERELNDDAATC